MLEVELDEAVGVAVFEELAAVQAALGHLTHELANAEVAAAEQRLRALQPLAGHHVLIAQNLLVDGANQG